MVEELSVCKICGGAPTVKEVFSSGGYYKCKKCDFPPMQFPLYQTDGMQREQWNKLNHKQGE